MVFWTAPLVQQRCGGGLVDRVLDAAGSVELAQVGRAGEVEAEPPELMLDLGVVGDVAADVGFYDQAHFTRHFKRHLSISPARYATDRR